MFFHGILLLSKNLHLKIVVQFSFNFTKIVIIYLVVNGVSGNGEQWRGDGMSQMPGYPDEEVGLRLAQVLHVPLGGVLGHQGTAMGTRGE